jgi:DNA topoisomerase-1
MTSESNKILLIVESPNKKHAFESYIENSNCQASFGHVYDLPPDKLAIDPNDNFKATYEIIKEKRKTVVNLLFHASKCKDIIICSDADREGEAIAWSLAQVLKLQNPKRLIFNEITAPALKKAMENITTINMDLVHSQQCRRYLDRLMGYKISPILQVYLQGALSSGRVQSIATMIIIDRENEVLESIKNIVDKSFYKSKSDFKFNDIIISGTLTKDKEYYKVENKELAIELLNKLDKKNICKVIDNTINEIKRNPQAPHITSTVLQECSTKLGFNSKKTMQVCQQLFEKGLITYHRSDSIAISDTAVGSIKKHIIDNYGQTYYQYRNYKAKVDENAQAGHECIRPTDIKKEKIDDIDGVNNDMIRVYNLIYKRTLASLMSSAIIDVQNINIDILTGGLTGGLNKSILPNDTFYKAIYEHIKFDGFLVLYNNDKLTDTDSAEEKPITGKIDIKKNDIVEHVETTMDETFNAALMRFNESALIKLFKKENIARPATYSSIISKIIDREYVKIQNIEGIPKDVLYMSVSNKKYGTIKEKIKHIKLASEKMKFVPTELGIKVNDFLMQKFKPIMDIKFTANMEDKLDLIEKGKAKWFNILREYYDIFNPICEQLLSVAPKKSLTDAYSANDKNLGEHNGTMIYLTKSKFGFCVKIMENDKWKYGNIGDTDPKEITLEQAIEFLKYPKDIGKIGSTNVILCKGKFGPYFKIGAKLVGIKDKEINIDDKDNEELLELAKELNSDTSDTKSSLPNNTYMIGKTKVYLKEGDNGPYLMVPHGDGATRKPTFISIPKGIDKTKLTATKIKEIIDNHKKQKTEGYQSKWKK